MAVEVAALFLAVVIAVAVVAFAVVVAVAVDVVVAVAVAVVVAAVVSVQQDGVACADLAVDEVRDHQALVSEEYDSQVDYVYAYLVH